MVMELKRFENFGEELNESTRYECETCGETLEHEEYDENPNMKCSNCGDSNWTPEQ